MPPLLGQLLQDQGYAKPDQIERALADQDQGDHQELLGEILIASSICTPEQVSQTIARSINVPFARISPRLVDPAVVALLPLPFLEKHDALPLFLVEGTLTVALADPANLFLIEEIARQTGHAVQVVCALARDIRATLQAYLPAERVFVVDEIVDDLSTAAADGPPDAPADAAAAEPVLRFADTLAPADPDPAALIRTAAEGPVIKLVNYVIHAAVKESAAQVHIEPAADATRIRFRIDGRLHDRLHPPSQMHAAVVARLKMLAGLDLAQQRRPQQGSIRLTAAGHGILLRVATLPGPRGEKIVLHVVDTERSFLRLERLGFSYDTLKAWRKLLARPAGLLLVAAPAGQGKTVTLHASLAELVRDDANVCALEESVEHQIPGVTHFAPDEPAGWTKSAALAAILRQEPDVLMLGDIGDAPTAQACTTSALSGRLILAGLSAANSAAAIGRLIQLVGQPYALGETLAAVLCQRLVRKLCPSCREAAAPTPAERKILEKYAAAASGPTGAAGASSAVETLYRAKGCPNCHHLGYLGRIGLFELLLIEAALAEKIARNASAVELREQIRVVSKSIEIDGIEKVRAGITTLDEVIRAGA